MHSLTWEQVHAWRLSQHYLTTRADREDRLDVVRRIGGLHAQVMSAAELALWARVENLAPTDVEHALWRDRTLVKSWFMRGTLHLLASSEYPLVIAALSTLKHFRRGSWLKYHGVTLDELDAIIEGTRLTMTDSGMTREQLAQSLASRMDKPELVELLLSGWGALLKPTSFQGYLCFAPNQGQNVTFVSPRQWLGEWTPIDSEEALREVARRFLAVFAPATVDEFDRWFGLEPSVVKRIFRSLADEIVEVDVEGWKGWALASSLPAVEAAQPGGVVRLLPHFDPYTLAVARHSHVLLDERYKDRVYRQQGWIYPVVLVDGRIVGIWEYDQKRSRVKVSIEPFAPLTDHVEQGIAAEVARLGTFLGAEADYQLLSSKA
jgi:uncharacterized protein YcaQ